MIEISRRDFCALAGAAIVGGCIDGRSSVVQTGALTGGSGAPDARSPIDAATIDSPTTLACTGNPIDVGPASGFALGQPVYFSSGNFFVVKDTGGYYALTAACTHEQATICVGTSTQCASSGTIFFCPRHGATFTFDGAVLGGPVFTPLVHYAMCDLPNGHLGVITTEQVAASTRLPG